MTVSKQSMKRIVSVVRNAKQLERYIEQCKKEALNHLLTGAHIDGLKLVRGPSSRTWINERQALRALRKVADINDVAPRKVISPAKAEKIDGVKDIASLVRKAQGRLMAVTEDDRRKAVEPAGAEFARLEGITIDEDL